MASCKFIGVGCRCMYLLLGKDISQIGVQIFFLLQILLGPAVYFN